MDNYKLSDVDAFQTLLTGHVQVSDPFRMDHKQPRIWMKPLWLEIEYDPYKGDRLALHKWIRPLNAPISLNSWEQIRSDRQTLNFSWAALPDTAFLEDPRAIEANWANMLGRGLGSMRVDGTRNGKFLSLEVSCHTRYHLSHHSNRGSFLHRPEALEVTQGKFAKDFPGESNAFLTCGRSTCGSAGAGKKSSKRGNKARKRRAKHAADGQAERASTS